MRIGYYQYCPEFGSPAQNLEKVQDTLAGIKADIIVLPELAFTGYFFEDRKELKGLAEDVSDSKTVISLSKFCQDNGFHLVVGFAERHKDNLYNSSYTLPETNPSLKTTICSATEGLSIIIPLLNNYAKKLKKGIINAQNPKSSSHWSRSNGFLFRRQIF